MKSLSRVSRTKKIALAVISLAFLCGIALFISEETHTTNLIRLPNGNTQAGQQRSNGQLKQKQTQKTNSNILIPYLRSKLKGRQQPTLIRLIRWIFLRPNLEIWLQF
jgi:hypothetical protein